MDRRAGWIAAAALVSLLTSTAALARHESPGAADSIRLADKEPSPETSGEPSPAEAPSASPSASPSAPSESPSPSSSPESTHAPRPDSFYASNPRGIGVYSSADGKLIRELVAIEENSISSNAVADLEYVASERLLYYAKDLWTEESPACGGEIWRFDPASGERSLVLRSQPDHRLSSIAVSPDGGHLAYVDTYCSPDDALDTLVLRDITTGAERRWPEATKRHGLMSPVVGLHGSWVAVGAAIHPGGIYALVRIVVDGPARTVQDGTVWPGMERLCGEYESGWSWGHAVRRVDGAWWVVASCGTRTGFVSYQGEFDEAFDTSKLPGWEGWSGTTDHDADDSGDHVLFSVATNHAGASFAWSPRVGFTEVDLTRQVQWGGDGDWVDSLCW